MSRGAGVQPFEIHIPVAELAEVSARLAATRGFDDLFGDDPRYGAPASFVHRLREHWLNGFDWRALEARAQRVLGVPVAALRNAPAELAYDADTIREYVYAVARS